MLELRALHAEVDRLRARASRAASPPARRRRPTRCRLVPVLRQLRASARSYAPCRSRSCVLGVERAQLEVVDRQLGLQAEPRRSPGRRRSPARSPSLDSTWRRIRPHRSSSHETLTRQREVRRHAAAPSRRACRAACSDDARAGRPTRPTATVGNQLLRACHDQRPRLRGSAPRPRPGSGSPPRPASSSALSSGSSYSSHHGAAQHVVARLRGPSSRRAP